MASKCNCGLIFENPEDLHEHIENSTIFSEEYHHPEEGFNG